MVTGEGNDERVDKEEEVKGLKERQMDEVGEGVLDGGGGEEAT